MKKLALMLFACLVTQCLGAEPADLIANPGFEVDANGDKLPDGWPKASANIEYLEESGNHFARLKVTEPGKMVMLYRMVEVKPGEQFELSFRVRYDGIKAGANPWFDGRVMLNFKDASKKVVKGAPSAPNFKGTSKEWKDRTLKLTAPEGATMLEIMPSFLQAEAGTLDIDDIKLVRVEAAAANPAK